MDQRADLNVPHLCPPVRSDPVMADRIEFSPSFFVARILLLIGSATSYS